MPPDPKPARPFQTALVGGGVALAGLATVGFLAWAASSGGASPPVPSTGARTTSAAPAGVPTTDVPPPLNVRTEGGEYGTPGWQAVEPGVGFPDPAVIGGVRVADPADPRSPRRYTRVFPAGTFDQTDAATVPAVAAVAALRAGGMSAVDLPIMVECPSFPELFGVRMHYGLGRARRGWDGRAVAVSLEASRSGARIATVLDAPPEVMDAWNGATAAALMSGYLTDPAAIAPEVHARLIAAPLAEQSAVAARLGDLGGRVLIRQYLGLLMAQHQSTLDTMRQFNADLMVETQAITSDGLGVTRDGLGNAVLTPE